MSLSNWTYSTLDTEDMGDMEYKEGRETGKGSFSPGTSYANRVFLVKWERRLAFLDDLLGWAYQDGGNAIKRILPDEHPQITDFYATDATVEGMGELDKDNNDAPLFTIAKIVCNYKPLPFDVLEDSQITTELDRFVSRNYAFATEYLTLQGNMKWFTRPNHEALSNPPGKIVGTMEVVYTWHDVPADPSDPYAVPNLTAIQDCLGKLNSVSFDGYAAGTVLFLGPDPKMVTPKLTDDTFYWEIPMKMLVRDNGPGVSGARAGHNYVYDVANSRWDLITSDGFNSGSRIYEEADLNTLFTVS